MLSEGFWKFKACNKIDILHGDRHRHLILQALLDKDTEIQPEQYGYVLYGPQEALLAQPATPAMSLFLCICQLMAIRARIQ